MGICGVYRNILKEVEIAYRLRESFWSQGYGSEIAKRLLEYCFDELRFGKLTAYVVQGNTGSQKILARQVRFERKQYCANSHAVEYVYSLNKQWCATI